MFNPSFNIALGLAASASYKLKKHKIDIQNAFRLANIFHDEWKEQNASQEDINAEFQNVVFVMLDWADILGDGYSAKSSDKLQEWYDIYSSKKYYKVEKFILKNYDDGSISYKELEQYIKDMFHYLQEYIGVVKSAEENNEASMFNKLEPDYYDYAREELDSWLEESNEVEEEE